MTNNRPFVTNATSGGLPINNTTTTTQLANCVNDAIGYRMGRYTDTTAIKMDFFGIILQLLPNLQIVLMMLLVIV